MMVSIDVEDQAWLALADLQNLARDAVNAALTAAINPHGSVEVSLVFTDDLSVAQLNAEWRSRDNPTNVLSFPSPGNMPIPEGEPRPLGDIVLAYGVTAREAGEQGKTLRDHTVHLIVHGMLHLLGHDHENDVEAEAMEQLEAEILKGLGISDPYERH
ncbi:rRNA maturation RNase YbeY [Aestuariivirga sp.]|uniref:rRNA maturation RNase YbeY n=1 Tax=Aestuariivirga sp. TaxID=2650926 RepID=UPI003BAAE8C7